MNNFEDVLILLKQTLDDTRTDDDVCGAIKIEHQDDFLKFRARVKDILVKSYDDVEATKLANSYILSQIILIREQFDLEPLSFNGIDFFVKNLALEIVEKDKQQDENGNPKQIWDDLEGASCSLRDILCAVVVSNIESSEKKEMVSGANLFLSKLKECTAYSKSRVLPLLEKGLQSKKKIRPLIDHSQSNRSKG